MLTVRARNGYSMDVRCISYEPPAIAAFARVSGPWSLRPVYLPALGLWRQAIVFYAFAVVFGVVLELMGLGETSWYQAHTRRVEEPSESRPTGSQLADAGRT